jgi:hypothetical protein
VEPLRASAAFREQFLHELGHDALCPARYLPAREVKLPAGRRTRFKGALRDWEIAGSDTQAPLKLGRLHPQTNRVEERRTLCR